jgi:serine/threonine-protein kinase HipA
MTSNVSGECFVYITLPGATEPVTAGRFKLQTDRRGTPEGNFVYGRSYLARPDAVPLDPLELKLTDRTYRTDALNGVFGAIRDASPDFWGRRVIQRYLGVTQPSELEYLLQSPDDRAGALGFGRNATPPAPKKIFNQTLDLEVLQATADAIVADEDLPEGAVAVQVANLLLVGTSIGGARPKAVVEDETGLWIAKFNTATDPWNNARVEHAMLMLARACGLGTAESRVIDVAGRDVLLVKRFDREKTEAGYRRARMISALTLLRAEDTHQSRERWSYVQMVEELRRVSAKPQADATELFRRMCFNALISNIDDHPRNHALLAKDRAWRLSPAYDLTPAVPIDALRRDLAMECGDLGRFANANNLRSQSARFLLEPSAASALIDDMEARIRREWFSTAREAGVSAGDCGRIAGAFAYLGFRRTQQ